MGIESKAVTRRTVAVSRRRTSEETTSHLDTARSAAVRQRTLDEARRTVEATLVTENRATVLDLRSFRVIDEILLMSGAELPDQVPLLESHREGSTEMIRGSVSGMRNEGRQIAGTLRFSEIDAAADAWRLVLEGHLDAVSVGTGSLEFEEIPPGEVRTIDGVRYQASEERPLRITRRWVIREVSLVTIGADDEAKIRSRLGAVGPKTGVQTMNQRLRNYLVSLGLSPDANDGEAMSYLQTLSGAQRATADALLVRADVGGGSENGNGGNGENGGDDSGDGDDGDDSGDGGGENQGETQAAGAADGTSAQAVADGAVRAERERIATIRRNGEGIVPGDLISRAIGEGWSVDTASGVFLEHARAARSAAADAVGTAPNVNTRRTQRAELAGALRSAMIQRIGGDPMESFQVGREVPESQRQRLVERAANDGMRFADCSLVEIARHHLEVAGVEVPHGRDNIARAAVSTGSFGDVFLDSVNLVITRDFDGAPDSTGWCQETDVADFKQVTDATVNNSDGLKLLPRGGKAAHTYEGDSGEVYRVHRYAEQAVLDEQDIIDDALNALMDTAERLAQNAAHVRPDLVYSILFANANMRSDGTPLFDATHNNYRDAGSALSGETFQSGLSAMSKQTLANGRPTNLMARWTLVPQDLMWLIRQILNSGERRGTGEEDGTINPVQGIENDYVAEARLGVAGVTDPITGTHYSGSATNWFLAANRRTIKVAYLRGTNRRPTVRAFTLTQGQWGIGYDVKLDVGAGAIDWRGLQYNTGSS